MNIFDIIGEVTVAILMAPLKAAKGLWNAWASFSRPKPRVQSVEPIKPPNKAEGRPEFLTLEQDIKAQVEAAKRRLAQAQNPELYPDLLKKFNRSAAAAPQRSPSVSAGALTNQLPSARSASEIMKKDGWDSITRYEDPNANRHLIRLTNSKQNISKDLTLQQFFEELRKHGFNV